MRSTIPLSFSKALLRSSLSHFETIYYNDVETKKNW